MSSTRRIPVQVALLVLLLCVARSGPTAAQGKVPTPPPPREPVNTVHHPRAPARVAGAVYVGEPAPDFELDGSNGVPVRLASLRGRWTVLVFDDGRATLTPLATVHGALDSLDAQIVAVCRDKAHTLRQWTQREAIPFLVLSDLTGEISGLYGLADWQTNQTRPAFLLLDREGRVQMAFLGKRLPPDQIAALVRYAIVGL